MPDDDPLPPPHPHPAPAVEHHGLTWASARTVPSVSVGQAAR
ncbi:MAG: hypothetical protein ACRCU9_06005 [Iodobacter sp.]